MEYCVCFVKFEEMLKHLAFKNVVIEYQGDLLTPLIYLYVYTLCVFFTYHCIGAFLFF